jgi:hypothetical protein
MYPASMRLNRLSFALLLPALEIAIWLVLVPTQIGLIYSRLQQLNSPTSSTIRIAPGSAIAIQKPESDHPLFALALRFGTYANGDLIAAINLPGVFVDGLVSIPFSDTHTDYPAKIGMQARRAIVLPFYCLPVWWFVGVGLDVASGRRTLRWGWLLLGTVFFTLTAAVLVGLRFGMSEAERASMKNWVISGFCFWVVAFSAFPIAWILQRSRNAASRIAAQSAPSEGN